MSEQKGRIVFQGEEGANSHIACAQARPDMEAVPCATFDDVFAAVEAGDAELGMIPIENSVAGRIADIHRLLPAADLHIVGEHFLRVRHCLLGVPGAKVEALREVQSHAQALSQCRRLIRELGLRGRAAADTAGSAREIAAAGDATRAAIASELAAEIYGLEVLRRNIEDMEHNTTRFLLLAGQAEAGEPAERGAACITSFVFRVRNVPAALYKAMGGFATNGVNMTKLESYQLEGSFNATQFYADIEGNPAERLVRLALEELAFFTEEVRILGVYPASSERLLAAGEGFSASAERGRAAS